MKKISIYICKSALLLLTAVPVSSMAQHDTLLRRKNTDTSAVKLNMDAVYNRPFLGIGKSPVSLGGYAEANTDYSGTDGINEGLSFRIPRLTLFVASTVNKRIRFLSEIEMEDGGKEIAIEFASLDIELHPLLNLRGGILMNPIGAFNQNHDGPKWEFIERPVSATQIIPSTWSNVGFGCYGKYGWKRWIWAYELYATNGFNEKIIDNPSGRTDLSAVKENTHRFNESPNGIPLITAKTAVRNRKAGEIGLSWMGGVYNQFEADGSRLDRKRRVDLYAVDLNTQIRRSGTALSGEMVIAHIGVPDTYSQQFGKTQLGFFADIVQPVIRRDMFGWQKASFNIALRTEYADFNKGAFRETGTNIYDHVYALVPGISFRPSPQTVIRFNYRREWHRDLLGNPPSRHAAIQFGFSSYF